MAQPPGEQPAIERPREAWRPADLARLVFFSDAVFAIAITLLVLDIRLPEGAAAPADGQALVDALIALAPALFAFVVSFLVIASFWAGHLREFRVVERLDGRLLGLNLAFLLLVILLPFPTSVLARHASDRVAAVLYATFGLATGVMSALLWTYPTGRSGLAAATVTPAIARAVTYRVIVVPIVFAVSIPLALIQPVLGEWSWVLIAPLQSLVSRRFPFAPIGEA